RSIATAATNIGAELPGSTCGMMPPSAGAALWGADRGGTAPKVVGWNQLPAQGMLPVHSGGFETNNGSIIRLLLLTSRSVAASQTPRGCRRRKSERAGQIPGRRRARAVPGAGSDTGAETPRIAPAAGSAEAAGAARTRAVGVAAAA